MINELSKIGDINSTKYFEKFEKGDQLDVYFKTLESPTIEEFDSLSIPVLSFVLNDVDRLQKGVYSSTEEKEEIVNERNKPIYRAIKTEFFKFLCTDSKTYKKDRSRIVGEFDKAVEVISAAISSTLTTVVLGPLAGIAVGVITALIAVMLKIALKIGIKTWCASL